MKKQITVGETTYTIEVILNARVEKRLNGIREHKVYISDDISTDHQDYLISDISQLKKIEETLTCKKIIQLSKEEIELKELGYK